MLIRKNLCFGTLVGVLLLGSNVVGSDAQKSQPLALIECVHKAIQNNLTLAIHKIEREQAALVAEWKKEKFFPRVFFDVSFDKEHIPSDKDEARALTQTKENTWHYDGGIETFTPLGTNLSLGLTNSRRGTNDTSEQYNPEHETRLELALTQSVLQGFGIDVNMAELNHARLAYKIATQTFRRQINELVRNVEQAYWDLFFAQQDVSIKAKSLAHAKQQYNTTRENIQRGLLPEHDVYVVEESVVSFQREHGQAVNTLSSAQTALAELMGLPWSESKSLVAIDTPNPELLGPAKEEVLLKAGFELNPKLVTARLFAEKARITLVFEKNSRLPRLDLEASLALNGLADTLDSSYAQVFSSENLEGYVGIHVGLPVFNLLDRSRVLNAEMEVQQCLVDVKQAEQHIAFEIHNLRRNILHSLATYELACQINELARKKLEAQQEKYQAGIATLKDLVEFLREADEAEIKQAHYLVQLVKEVVELHIAIGDLHQHRGIYLR